MNGFSVTKELSKNGLEILKYKQFYLHSRFDPLKEAERFVNQNYKEAAVQLLIGYGSGYIYEALQNIIGEDEKIIVVDPLVDLSTIENSLGSLDEMAVRNFIDEQINEDDTYNVMTSINFDKVIEDSVDFTKFLTKLKEKLIENILYENTLNLFDGQLNDNYLKNLSYIFQDYSAQKLTNLGSMPIVVASGGPSLTKQLELVKKYRKKIILIAAGTTINSLLVNDIEPDLVVSIDGGEVNYNHFKKLEIEKFPIAYLTSNHYGVRKQFKNGYYFLAKSNEGVFNHLSKYNTDEPLGLIGGGSVANFAYELALLMTTGPVTLIGQDLSFTNQKAHAEGNLNNNKIDHSTSIFEEGYYGDKVETMYPYVAMRNRFVDINEYYDAENRSFNSTEGGMKIPKFSQIDFESFLNLYALENLVIDFNYDSRVINKEKYEKAILNDINSHKKLKVELNKALISLKNNKSKISFDNSTLKTLDKLDESIKKNIKETSLLEAIALLQLNVAKYFKVSKTATAEERFKIINNQNEYLYSELKNIVNNSLQTLQEIKILEEK